MKVLKLQNRLSILKWPMLYFFSRCPRLVQAAELPRNCTGKCSHHAPPWGSGPIWADPASPSGCTQFRCQAYVLGK